MAANNTKEGHAGTVSLLMKEHTNTYKVVTQNKTNNLNVIKPLASNFQVIYRTKELPKL